MKKLPIAKMQKDYVRPGFVAFGSQRPFQADEIISMLPPLDRCTYIEPCVGSGNVVFNLIRQGKLKNAERIILNDNNPALISMYIALQSKADDVAAILFEIEEVHNELDSYSTRRNYYKQIRDEYNACNTLVNSNRRNVNVQQAARLLWLDMYSNGYYYRTNSLGHFNLPAIKADQPLRRLDIPKIVEFATLLKRYDIEYTHNTMYNIIREMEQHHRVVMYLDPPRTSTAARKQICGRNPRLDYNDSYKLIAYLVDNFSKEHHILGTNIRPPSLGLSSVMKDVYLELVKRYYFYRLTSRRVTSGRVEEGYIDDVALTNYYIPRKELYIYQMEEV